MKKKLITNKILKTIKEGFTRTYTDKEIKEFDELDKMYYKSMTKIKKQDIKNSGE